MKPPKTEGFDHKAKKAEHMVRRYDAHGSYRKLGEEFGVSKSQAHRIVSAKLENADKPQK